MPELERLWHKCFPVNFAKFLRTPFFSEHLRAAVGPNGVGCFWYFWSYISDISLFYQICINWKQNNSPTLQCWQSRKPLSFVDIITWPKLSVHSRNRWKVRSHSYIESSHSLRQNGTKLQTHLPSTLNAKVLNLPKINVYNFRYKITVGILIKVFFLLHKCIYK